MNGRGERISIRSVSLIKLATAVLAYRFMLYRVNLRRDLYRI